MLPSPTVLATLTHPTVANEPIHAAPVHGLEYVTFVTNGHAADVRKHLRRTRRAEVAVACPGGGVQIYNVGIAQFVAEGARADQLAPAAFCSPGNVLCRSSRGRLCLPSCERGTSEQS